MLQASGPLLVSDTGASRGQTSPTPDFTRWQVSGELLLRSGEAVGMPYVNREQLPAIRDYRERATQFQPP